MRSQFLSLLFLALGAATVRAELVFEQPRADLGEVRRGPVLLQRFVFVNRGAESVEVVDAKTTCGCLVPKFSARTIAAGGAGWVELEVNTLTQPAGPHSWRVDLFYQIGERRLETAVVVQARLIAEIEVLPAALQISGDRKLTHEITVTDRRPQPFKVIAVQPSSPHLWARLGGTRHDDQGRLTQVIFLEVSGDCPDGKHDEIVAIYTDDPGYRELRMPVSVVKRARQRVTASPASLNLRTKPGQPVPAQIILLRDAEGQQVVVDQVMVENPALTATFAQGPNTMSTIKVQVDDKGLSGEGLRGSIQVHISQPASQVITIPLECTVVP